VRLPSIRGSCELQTTMDWAITQSFQRIDLLVSGSRRRSTLNLSQVVRRLNTDAGRLIHILGSVRDKPARKFILARESDLFVSGSMPSYLRPDIKASMLDDAAYS
jgi:hypothetical protein